MTATVVCVGDVMVDIVASLPSALATGSDTPAPISLLGGGSAANTACWLSTAGAHALLIARIGADDLGTHARADLVAAGVELHLTASGRTGRCIVLVDPGGERTMVPDAGANAALSPADIDPSVFAAHRHLHLSAYSLFHAGPDATRRALDLARSAGMSISVDAASAAPLADFGVEHFRQVIGPGVMLIANLDEARTLTGVKDPEDAARSVATTFGTAVIKLGADGALWCDDAGLVRASTVALEAIDSTGAGDAFAAGLLATHLSGGDPETSLKAANELAARACRTVGGRPPSRSE